MAGQFYYAGQAVLDGVMMRGKRNIAIVVRRPDGEMAIHNRELSPFYTHKARQIPLIRGVMILLESLTLGIQGLLYSARMVEGEEAEKEQGGAWIWLMGGLSLSFAIALFFIIPLLFTHYLVDPYIGSPVLSNLIEGCVRLVIFILYLWAVGRIPEISRTFAYHGAEHKTVNALESGAPLEPEAVGLHQTTHLRCGTSFLLILMIIAIIVFAFVGKLPLGLTLASRVVLLPLIVTISYEITRLAVSHSQNILIKALLRPGLALQKMTTRQPDDGQIEVAITALKEVLRLDAAAEPPSLASPS